GARGGWGGVGVGPDGGSDGEFLQILDPGRQCTRIQHESEVLGILLGHSPAADTPLIMNLFVDGRDLAHFVVENYRQPVSDMRPGKSRKLSSPFVGKSEVHFRSIAGIVPPHLRATFTQILTGNSRTSRDQVVLFTLIFAATAGNVVVPQ